MVHDAFASFGVKNTFSCSLLNLLRFWGKKDAPLTPALAPRASIRGNTVFYYHLIHIVTFKLKQIALIDVCSLFTGVW